MIAVNGTGVIDQAACADGCRIKYICLGGALVYEGLDAVDRAALLSALEDAAALNRWLYTRASQELLDMIAADAQEVCDDEEASQEDVDAAALALREALACLVFVTFTVAQKTVMVKSPAGTVQLSVTYNGIGTVTYESNNTPVATVSQTGLVRGIKPGGAVVTVGVEGLTGLLVSVTVS